ncbi:protein-methionine-sulfoxide reductase heme-binding subunit MsrQ [Novacetimonas hansenii]|uniref:protein-methionine-sulfoxide reductase heme-binding subunit MsrQ n=1 Tax=Novacetimonas hansenii TaxID=436 RepID=UPI00094F9349|nr:protein-methionine-sulfoxide reductase heme-binding subunit MsrQ [Novacetimonas hansenii]
MPYISGPPRHRTVMPWRFETWVITLLGLMPAALYFWYGAHDQLGADPVNVFERWLGLWAVRFLLVTLCITPLREVSGYSLLRYRRTFGLLVFWYACMHVAVYVALDQQFDMAVLWRDITHRPFLMIGAGAFTLLVPLALTSNTWSIRTLGRRWRGLHRLTYGVAILTAVHFLMAFKTYTLTSVGYAAALGLLVLWRGRQVTRMRTASGRGNMTQP